MLPNGWTGYVDGIATNKDPIAGGIIDKTFFAPTTWFVIPQNDAIPMKEGFNTQAEAFEYLAQEVAKL